MKIVDAQAPQGMDKFIDNVFGPTGALAGKFPGYKPREGQVQMTRFIGEAITAKGHAVVEGPTGVGKSVAYLVPAIKAAKDAGTAVVVATANIALQEQLVQKDLPMLVDVLATAGVEFTFAMMKGRNNYLCLERFEADPTDDVIVELESKWTPADRDAAAVVTAWADGTPEGDVNEMPAVPPPHVWRRFSVSSDDCLGSDCPLKQRCYANMAKERAMQSDVVVTNYHMLFADMQVRAATDQEVTILPPYQQLVCDEAHKAADIARGFMGSDLRQGGLRAALEGLKFAGADADTAAFLGDCVFDEIAVFFRSPQYKVRLRKPLNINLGQLKKVVAGLITEGKAIARNCDDAAEKIKKNKKLERAITAMSRLEDFITMKAGNTLYYIEEDHKGRLTLVQELIDVGEELQANLWRHLKTAVVTSATLRTGTGFDYIIDELGIALGDKVVDTLAVQSPFDFWNRCLMVIPSDMPDPQTDGAAFFSHLPRMFERLVTASSGRTLGLFTSYRNLQHVATNAKFPYTRFVQGSGLPRTQMVQEFKADISSVLLGTESFWAGVDVPGEALSQVVIDKLPFPGPHEPMMDLMVERYPNDWFFRYSLPRMVMQLAQGFGRSIRDVNDRAVVVILDNRLAKKGYRGTVLAALPKCPVAYSTDGIKKFLEGPQ